jgi:hypothetical protein
MSMPHVSHGLVILPMRAKALLHGMEQTMFLDLSWLGCRNIVAPQTQHSRTTRLSAT